MLSRVRRASSLFDPMRHAKTRLPLGQAMALPGDCYTSPEWHEKELANVFGNSPVLMGRDDELPHPGSYLALDAPGIGPVCCIKGKDGQIRAFANVCKHRGAKILQDSAGSVARVTCPYHAWTYRLDGKLVAAPAMKNCSHFEKAAYGLDELRLENLDGFLFLSKPAAPPLSSMVGNLSELLLDTWKMSDWVTVGRAEYEVNANWKYVFENTAETYHTPVVHRDSLGSMPSTPCSAVVGQPVGDWDAIHVPYGRSVVPLPEEAAPFPEVAPTTFFTNIFPCLQVNITKDCAWWMRMLPMGTNKTKVVQGFVFPRETVALPDFKENLQPYLNRWRLAVTEDNDICENQQAAAVSATANAPGPYADLEFGTHKFDNFVLDRVLGQKTDAATLSRVA